MKILHVIPSVSEAHGGPSAAIRAMTRALAKDGLEVHIATTDDDGVGRLRVPLGRPVLDNGVATWYFPRQTSFYKFSWPLTTWLSGHVAGYDLLHIHALFSYPSLPASFAACRSGVPYIIRPLGTLNRWGMQHRRRWLKRVSFLILERRMLANAAMVHYTSEDERAEAVVLGVKRPAAIIPIGVDVTNIPCIRSQSWLSERAPHLVGRRIILFLSRIVLKKGLGMLLEAFAKIHVARPNLGLLVVGDGDWTFVRSLRQKATDLGIDSDTYWAGRLTGSDKSGALASADIFVLPSFSENFGISVVEAMASGLPVIITDQVAIQGDVDAAKAGCIVRCEVGSIAEALVEVLDNPTRGLAMGKMGRELAKAKYSIEAMTQMLLGAYSEIVKLPMPKPDRPPHL